MWIHIFCIMNDKRQAWHFFHSPLGLLNDSTVGIFRSCQQLRLRRACIRTARISAEAFHRALCPHRLLELDASRVNADLTISDIVRGLASSKELRDSLQRLVLNGLTMTSLEEPSRRCFGALQGLRSLSVAHVDFYDSGLADVCSLPRLESLDISSTSVTNLTPLLGLRTRLRYLTMHQLKRLEMTTAQLLAVLSQVTWWGDHRALVDLIEGFSLNLDLRLNCADVNSRIVGSSSFSIFFFLLIWLQCHRAVPFKWTPVPPTWKIQFTTVPC